MALKISNLYLPLMNKKTCLPSCIKTTQGQFISASKEGLAFTDQDFRDEFENSDANAKPLKMYIVRHLF